MHLYTYDHCPFCTRARMIFGLKNRPLDNRFLASDDEATPIQLIGKKMLPILVKDDGSAMGESLDIVQYIDALDGQPLDPRQRPEIVAWLEQIDHYQRFLVWPRVIKAGLAEFATPQAVAYFVNKKSAVIGDFDDHWARSDEYRSRLNADLQALVPLLAPQLSEGSTAEAALPAAIEDILLFPVLRNLTLVRDVQWPAAVRDYLQRLSRQSGVPLWHERAL